MTRQSLPSMRITSPARSRNGYLNCRQKRPTNSGCEGSEPFCLLCFIRVGWFSGSIILRHEHSRNRPVSLGNDPEFQAGGRTVNRQKTSAIDQRLVVGDTILPAYFT